VILLILAAVAVCAFVWWTSELPELWTAIVVLVPILQHLI
jgi:hypothetical protein